MTWCLFKNEWKSSGLLKNYKLKPYFENIDTERLIHHQIGFISHLLGKPANIHVEKVLTHSHKGRCIAEIKNTVRIHKT